MDNSIALLKEFTQFQISDQDAQKYLKWSKGNVQTALNYYYTKQDKQQSQNKNAQSNSTLKSNAFDQLKQGQQKQRQLEKIIKNLKEEYAKPIEEQARKTLTTNTPISILNNFDLQNKSFSSIQPKSNYSSSQKGNNQSTDQKQIDHTQQNKQVLNQTQEIDKNGQLSEKKSKIRIVDEQIVEQMVGKKQDFVEQVQRQYDQQQQMTFPYFLGQFLLKGIIVGSKNLSYLSQGDKMILTLESSEKIQNKKKASREVRQILRINDSQGEEIGRVETQFEKLLFLLLKNNYIQLDVFYYNSQQLCQTLTPILLQARVYLLKSSVITSQKDNVDQTEENIKYLDTRQQFLDLFQLLKLQLISPTLINYEKTLKSKQFSKVEPIQESNQNNQVIVQKQENRFEDPFWKKPKQQSIYNFTQKLPGQKQIIVKEEVIEKDQQDQQDNPDFNNFLNEKKYQDDDLQPYQPASTFTSTLYDYQKTALSWLLMREGAIESQIDYNLRVLHPLWQEYKVGYCDSLYFNPFSGQLSFQIPLSSQKCRGGILADEMGLGKTIMMIALIHTHKPNARLHKDNNDDQNVLKKNSFLNVQGQKKLGNTLIVLPLMLLSQWEEELKSHSMDNSLKFYLYYGTHRRLENLSHYDVVLTTYGTLSQDYSEKEKNGKLNNTLYDYQWFRTILDEAHYIKGRTIQIAQAVYNLQSQVRWCCTGTPIQNKLDDLFSLIHFIKLEPWSDYLWWNNHINKQLQQGNQGIFELLWTIIKPIMLRRTKQSKDKDGKLILNLPKKNVQMHLLQAEESERQVYKVMEQKSQNEINGYLAKNVLMAIYMQILELILRLRQVCDHPILLKHTKKVANTQQIQDEISSFLMKRQMVKQEESNETEHFELHLDGSKETLIQVDKQNKPLSWEAIVNYKEELFSKIRSNQLENCPVCLDKTEDTALTSCLHLLCKSCLFGILQNSSQCPICRFYLTKEDYIILPSEESFGLDWKQNYRQSSKIKKILELVIEVINRQEKIVIFSQFLGMIDLIQYEFEKKQIQNLRLDGSLTEPQRRNVLNKFKQNNDYQVLIISLKAGGVGLNLTVANNAILVDPWWNPAVEEQAIERVHRIGQDKEVNIHRLLMEDTIEERMIELHKQKKMIFDATLSVEDKKNEQIKMFTKLVFGNKQQE